VSSLLHSIIYVGSDGPRGSRAPIRKHRVGQDIDMCKCPTSLDLKLERNLSFNSNSLSNLNFLWIKLFLSSKYSKLHFISIFLSSGRYFLDRPKFGGFEII
jgi:hypothetical protein